MEYKIIKTKASWGLFQTFTCSLTFTKCSYFEANYHKINPLSRSPPLKVRVQNDRLGRKFVWAPPKMSYHFS